MEHLQLTLQEAFFLTWSLGCLRVLDPSTVRQTIFHQAAAYKEPAGQVSLCTRSPTTMPPTPDTSPFPRARIQDRQPVHGPVCSVSSLSLSRLGNSRRYQVLRGLSALQKGPAVPARRVNNISLIHVSSAHLSTYGRRLGSALSSAPYTKIQRIARPPPSNSRM